VDDLDSKARRRMNEQDEYEEEERERINKHKLNEKFKRYV
jgi:nucleosome binding factor SPN SPT16 subunit